MSSEQILNEEESSRKTRRKRDKINIPNKERKEEKSQEIKLPQPIIYEPSENNNNNHLSNVLLTTSNDNNNQDQRRQNTITYTDAKEITDYYFTFHKNMLIIYNSIYSQMLQDISNFYNNDFLTFNENIIDYSTQIEDMYNGLTSKRDKSLKLVDTVITKNLDTYIKSIKQAQKFYKDVTESYLNCIRKK
ncbi:MAG TPA: hypothetical protein VJ697_00420 [Nitrososphaeraceae archaeon]|nr:hypothetical protein [Nitrososphaeraceae archaeon]